MRAVIGEQRQEIDYLQNMLERLTTHHDPDTHGWYQAMCCSIFFAFFSQLFNRPFVSGHHRLDRVLGQGNLHLSFLSPNQQCQSTQA